MAFGSRLVRLLSAALVCLTLWPAVARAQYGWPRSAPPPAPSSREYGEPASPELARTIALVCTALPIGAGAVTWAVQGETSVTSWVLLYFGTVEGPALGYHYAGFHRAAREGEALRSLVALSTLLVAADRDTDEGFEAVMLGGAVLTSGLAAYEVVRLPDRMRSSQSGARLEIHPALVAGRLVPAATLRF
ncbi:MAG: hypothetical protein HZA61_00310 [Candidatus Eisenbacteria bacterium]|uniref:DUF5683 domain-containing protein n=1 Tax=Eiseniibacteriota bacterium TaxID=2212470 RepID=A0A933W0F4_UNCEI|nr:hypothetical protein [Candidatus Eisenbacteria bacterium]